MGRNDASQQGFQLAHGLSHRQAFAFALLFAASACGGDSADTETTSGNRAEPEMSKVVPGPLQEAMFDRRQLPPLDRLAPNGMRVSIGVGEQELSFVADFKPHPHGCAMTGEGGGSGDGPMRCDRVEVDYFLVDADVYGRGTVLRSTHGFEVPEEDYQSAIDSFNAAAGNWSGERATILGGTWVEVEQFHEGRMRSISSNSDTPSAPTAMLLPRVHGLLLAYAPAGTVPRSVSFAAEAPYSEQPCSGAEMNAPDPDGFGVGNDACARARGRSPAERR